MAAENSVIYHTLGETVIDSKVFYRKSVGLCRCQQHYDGHEHGLYHTGAGRWQRTNSFRRKY